MTNIKLNYLFKRASGGSGIIDPADAPRRVTDVHIYFLLFSCPGARFFFTPQDIFLSIYIYTYIQIGCYMVDIFSGRNYPRLGA